MAAFSPDRERGAAQYRFGVLSRVDVRGVPDLRGALPRPIAAGDDASVIESVRRILQDVRDRGDHAVRDYTRRFDGVQVDDLAVSDEERKCALDAIAPDVRNALETAAANVAEFARAEMSLSVTYARDGLRVQTLRRAVERAGCYVPGGRAVYPSTVLMTAVPARVAGVDEVVVCVPPDSQGRVPDVVLAATVIAGADAVYRIGGAQAIGAMAYGTESVPPVDVIVGPGNLYVAVAKREVAGEGRVGIPSAFAGPSEVVVVADDSVAADLAAIDVIVQAEHGREGLAWLVTWSEAAADSISAAITALVADAPRRNEIESTLDVNGRCVLVDGPEQAIAVANLIAPEHLELLVADPQSLVPMVRHAGAVFCGPWAPASVGDYVAGPSHVLPTHGSARFAGALTADDFTKPVHVIDVDRRAFEQLGPAVVALAEAEGLVAHADSIRIRER
jgi:histidinol dehydrogenase